ncbi:VOC family protein [Rodentibacter caecimuris]|uniref:Metalloprotein n=1 Tax=Rodentibacter caecimuris TaxID=1796644 RepID=A0ABX3KZY3_9PAST|nr:metalloprotein [Rodentibacter heylii]
MTNLSMKLTALLGCLSDFEQKILELSKAMNIELCNYVIDHIALRVNTEEKARNWLTLLLNYGRILGNNVINGRPIYLIELKHAVTIIGQSVDIIELPFPKNKKYPKETWEHIEIVIPFLPNESSKQWVERIYRQFLWEKLTNLSFKISEPKAESEQLPNPSIAVSFSDKSLNHTCIKVHPYHIKKILEV